MTDIVDKATRSRMMGNIRGKDTAPEMIVRRFLHSKGFRYSLHNRRLPGNPDIVLRKYQAVLLVHGCYWHRHEGCRLAYEPKTRREFWTKKFESNVARDIDVKEQLTSAGWRVMTVWECGLRDPELREKVLSTIINWLKSDSPVSELPPKPRRSK